MEVLIAVHLKEVPEGGFMATSDELPDLLAYGKTVTETLEIAQDVAHKLIESYKEHGDPLPTSLKTGNPVGREVHIPVSVS